MRLFIAIPLPKQALRAALAARERLLLFAEGARPVGEDSFHITLRFIGESRDILSAATACREAVRGIRPIPLTLSQYGVFGKPGAQTLHISVTGDLGELRRLSEGLEGALTSAGFPQGRKPFVPHVTLARSVALLEGAALPLLEETAFTASRITLFESRNTGAGVIYLPLHEERLG